MDQVDHPLRGEFRSRATPTHDPQPVALPPNPFDARPSKVRKRSRVKSLTFLLVSIVPTIAFSGYLYFIATDQYISEFRFTIQHSKPVVTQGSQASGALVADGLAAMAVVESETVVQYIQSRQIVDDLSGTLNLRKIYDTSRADWWWRLPTPAPPEELVRYWRRMVEPYFDLTNGIVTVQVRAFSPDEAEQVAVAVQHQAEDLINGISSRSRHDTEEYAQRLVNEAEARLRRAELAIRDFRNTNTLLTPEMTATITGKLESQLRDEIAEAKTSLNVLQLQGLQQSAPKVVLLRNRISSLQEELTRQQSGITSASAKSTGGERPLASSISDYNALDIEVKIAATAYSRALDGLSVARAGVEQQSIYLATFVKPSRAGMSMFPRRERALLTFAVASIVAWALLLLIGYAVRDHMD